MNEHIAKAVSQVHGSHHLCHLTTTIIPPLQPPLSPQLTHKHTCGISHENLFLQPGPAKEEEDKASPDRFYSISHTRW